MPKFLSFRRPTAEKSADGKDEPRQSSSSRDRESTPSHRKHASSQDKPGRSHKVSDASRGETTKDRLPTVREVEVGDVSFAVDTKGDKQNVVYNSVYAGEIPPYRRIGSGQVLGLDRNQRIDRSTKHDSTLLVADPAVYRDQRPDRATLPKAPSRAERVIPRVADEQERAESLRSNFIALDENSTAIIVADGQSILSSLRHPEETSQPKEQALEYDKQDDFEGELLQKRASIQRLIKLEPGELQHWLDLAAIQGDIVRRGRTVLSQGEERGLAEVRLSLYERALKEHSLRTGDRLTLAKLFMTEVEKVYNVEMQQSKWEETLREPDLPIELWASYLEFLQKRSKKWNLPDVRSSLEDAKGACQGNRVTAGAASARDETEIYRILRLSVMMNAVGLTEYSMALWQALLELHFLRPHAQEQITENVDLRMTVLEQFKAFWDEEKARVGEPGVYDAKTGVVRNWSHRSTELPEQASTKGGTSNGSWLQEELRTESHSQLPARIAQEDITDPLRVVLFEDIARNLSFFDPKASNTLLDGFLAFCGLPPLHWKSDGFTSALKTDSFLRSTLGQAAASADFGYSCFHPDAGNIRLTATSWIDCEFNPELKQNVQILQFARKVLETLLWSGQSHLATYILQFVGLYFPSEAAATAKRLLKKFTQNIQLYCLYALVERRNGRLERSEAIFEATTGMVAQLPVEEARMAIYLYRRWAAELIIEGKVEDALRMLNKGWQTISSTQEYKELVQQASDSIYKPFELGRDHMLRQNRLDLAIEFQICNSYHQYLSSNLILEPTLAAFRYGSQLLQNRAQVSSSEHEKLHQAKVLLLYNHAALRTAYKPALLRDEFDESLFFFPSNTIFLSMAHWIESKVGIEDRLRSKLSKSLQDSSSESIIRVLFSIWREQTASRGAGYNSNSLRATFQRAVESSVSKSNSAVWGMYFQFEVSEKSAERARAVFFEGLRACPWDKQFVLLAFAPETEDIFSKAQLQDIYRLAVERGLRFHINYEDYQGTL